MQLLNFTARKSNIKDVLAQWTTASEQNINRYEIELAKGNSALQQNQFVKIGEVSSQGNSATEQHYTFTDIENSKSGARYYRLKIIENDGSFTYSAIRPVIFDQFVQWQVYPNPSNGIFNLSFQANGGEKISVKLYDLSGKIVKQYSTEASGFVQKINIDIRDAGYASGLYLIEATAGENKKSFRVLKQ